MPKRVTPTGKQKSAFMIHFVVYAIAFIAMWSLYDKGATEWAYPWPAWITAAWGLALIGHWCAVYRSYEDKGADEFYRQAKNG
jgi:hypothetical protein